MIGVCINWVATPQSPHRLRTKTATVIKREASNAEEVQLQCALAAYQEALLSNDLLSVCEAARRFNVPKTTPGAHQWTKCALEFNSEKSWLGDAESEVIVKDLIYSAQQGFPDAKRHLHGRVNAVIQDKLGGRSFHVGENWVDCRLEKWGKSISYIVNLTGHSLCKGIVPPCGPGLL